MMTLLLTMTTVPWLEPTAARAESISTYVSGRGNDGNSCTNSKPCKTLQRALALTAPGGQINALDSADYGYVTINKAVSIVSAKGSTGVLAPSSVSGITINAGATDVVNLQGLEIDGAGSGANGIQFISGAALNVKDSVIRGFNNGINFQPTGASTLSLSHALISNNSTGVAFRSSTAGSNVLDNVQIVGNGTGISVTGTNSATPVNVTIQNSVVANNPSVGVMAGNYSNVTVTNSTLANNGVGLQAQSVSAHLQVSGSSFSGNTTGWVDANGGQIISSSGNVVGGNTNGDTALSTSAPTLAAAPHASTPTPTMAGKDPILFAKNIVTDFGAKCDGVANDNAAFTAFNTWAQSQTGTIMLTIPSGSICMFTSASMGNWFAKGIKSLIVTGYGATLSDNNGTGNGFFLGGRAVVADNMHSSRLETVLAGATTVTLKAQSESARFQVGNWALITGLDMMGYGYPPNPAFFEYVQITAIDPSTGIITFASPLKNTYKSTWPLYNAGSDFEADQGGPATLYALDPSWNTQVEYRGLTISQAGQTYANGRSVTFRDVTFTGVACGVPSQSMLWQVINSNMPNCGMEVDKLIDTLVISGVPSGQSISRAHPSTHLTWTAARLPTR